MLTQNNLPDRHTCHLHLPISALPVVSPQEFKDAMVKLAFSICVVTAGHSEEEFGRTVTSFMPLSADPAHIIVSIDVRSRLIDLISLRRSFSVSFPSVDQENVAEAFAGKWFQTDRFSVAECKRWQSGNRKLEGAALTIDCELIGSVDVGDHMLFVGAIIEADVIPGRNPLIWNDRKYRKLSTIKSMIEE